jgi:pentatricopeptide repeat protein
VQPDERLYGSLMSVAGAAGDVGLAFSLLDEMEAEGLRPSKVHYLTGGLHHMVPQIAGPRMSEVAIRRSHDSSGAFPVAVLKYYKPLCLTRARHSHPHHRWAELVLVLP